MEIECQNLDIIILVMTSFLQTGMQSMSAVMLCNFLRIQFYRKFDIVLLRSFAEIG